MDLSSISLAPIEVGTTTNCLRDSVVIREGGGVEVSVELEENEAEWVGRRLT